MDSYAVFLRGINVGGINIRMADLREALKGCGFTDAKTLLASGNVVLTSGKDAAAVKRECEKCLRDSFGYEAWVVVLPADRVAGLVEACPYPEDDKATHSYITLSSDAAVLDELDQAGAALGDGHRQQRLGPEALAWLAPAGGTLDSPFSKISAKARFKAATTTRNLRTMIKVRDAATGLAKAGD
ncbi:pyridoxamine 5'-phosphate oxidase [Arthrobacter sp. NtRootA9]|nr:pyridoxamine 5'-phosphate oxidase [Arthrobacter sp. NtRootA9]